MVRKTIPKGCCESARAHSQEPSCVMALSSKEKTRKKRLAFIKSSIDLNPHAETEELAQNLHGKLPFLSLEKIQAVINHIRTN